MNKPYEEKLNTSKLPLIQLNKNVKICLAKNHSDLVLDKRFRKE